MIAGLLCLFAGILAALSLPVMPSPTAGVLLLLIAFPLALVGERAAGRDALPGYTPYSRVNSVIARMFSTLASFWIIAAASMMYPPSAAAVTQPVPVAAARQQPGRRRRGFPWKILLGVIVATQLSFWQANLNTSWLSFGRLRPLHTNAAIFAFVGNMMFAGIYYSTQRLCKCRTASDLLSSIHFWGWQLIIVAAAITLPLGITQGKEYAELEWPIDIAIAVVWVAFAVNFFGTIAKRRERHLYVAIWFYIATIVTITLLHVFNNLVVPSGLWHSYPIYAGVQDAFMQWWYGHNAVGFLLTTPFLGLMYYFLPKAANRPVFSYRLSILHFWTLVFIYIWAGPHHLHYTALPAWASTLGMLFSVMLWMP